MWMAGWTGYLVGDAMAGQSSRPAVGAAYKGFNDPLAMWGTNRQIHHQCGQTWMATFHEAGKFYSAGHQLPSLQIVTWNDYEEGTQIESGIDGCTFVVPSVSGNTLAWTVGGAPENTIESRLRPMLKDWPLEPWATGGMLRVLPYVLKIQ